MNHDSKFDMNPIFGIVLTAILFSVLCSSQSRSQRALSPEARRTYRQHQLQEALEEKLHIGLDSSGKGFTTEKNSSPETSEGMPNSPLNSVEMAVTVTPSEGEVHAAINPTDTNNLAICDMYVTGSAPYLAFPIYYTKDFGHTWKKSSFQPSPYESDAFVIGGGDPVLAYDANGTLYLSWINLYSSSHKRFGSMYWASSTDGGETWQRDRNGYIGIDSEMVQPGLSALEDKEWLAVDRSNSSYRNTLYAAWTHIDLDDNSYGIMVRRKLPGADSMEPPVQVSSPDMAGTLNTSLSVDAHGGVHVIYMGTFDTMMYSLYHVYSDDGGATFDSAVKISVLDLPKKSPDARQNSVFGIRTNGNYPCPQLSIDTAVTGNLYMVWDALGITANQNHGTDIYFNRSTDNGQSWSTPIVINNDRSQHSIDHFYPSIAVNAQGMITVTWYDRREDSNNRIGRYYVGQSIDQGLTWTNYPVATRPMNFKVVGDSNSGLGIGEYTQVLMTSNYTIPVWIDGRTNEGNLYAYAAFFPMTSTGIKDPPSGVAQPDRIVSIGGGIELLDNYPNPFTSETKVAFRINARAHARVYITNLLGQSIASIFDAIADAGEHDFTFDASKLASGIYYCNLETDVGTARRAIIVAR